jgi:glycosidase
LSKTITIFIALLLIAGIILIGGCIKKTKVTNEKVVTGAPKSLVSPSSQELSLRKGWIYEGPIYETHPYYYPGHSFKEITRQIPSLADLGIKTIYLMPIWKHENKEPPYNYLYLIADYDQIDPVYGTEDDLKELVDTVHAHNMKILFDMVTAVAPPESTVYKWTMRIPLLKLQNSGIDMKAQEMGSGASSTYVGRFVYSPDCLKGKLCKAGGKIEGNDVVLYTYPNPKFGPAVDRTNPDVIKYFTDVAVNYVNKYNIDGWRLDSTYNTWNPEIVTGDHSMIELTRSMKNAITQIKPDAVFFAEHPSVQLDEICDISYMSYDQFKTIGEGVIYGKIGSQQLVDNLTNEPIGNNRARAYYGETHDSPRDNKVFPQFNKPLLIMISTIPGVPMIQAGQEIGATNDWFFSAKSDPEVDWNNGDNNLKDFYRKVFQIRNTNNALKYGSFENVWERGDNNYAYLRTSGNNTVIVVLNFKGKTTTSTLNLPLTQDIVLYDELNDERFTVSDPANFEISVPAYNGRILVSGISK